jgi:hypothetical protein
MTSWGIKRQRPRPLAFVPPPWLRTAIDAVLCAISFTLGAINVYCWRGWWGVVRVIPREPWFVFFAGPALFGACVALANAVRVMRKVAPIGGRVTWLSGILLLACWTGLVYVFRLWELGRGPPI